MPKDATGIITIFLLMADTAFFTLVIKAFSRGNNGEACAWGIIALITGFLTLLQIRRNTEDS